MTTEVFDQVYGCTIGGAIGDALGAPVMGWSYEEVRENYGRMDEFRWSDKTHSDGVPGSVTGDTILRHYLSLAIIRSGGRILPDDVAEVWKEHLDPDQLWLNEEIIYLKLQIGLNPWETGRGMMETGHAVMGISPIGIINAGNPRQAYQDAYNIASLNQDGAGRSAAAVLAAGVATAFQSDATVDEVIRNMADLSSGTLYRAIDLTMLKVNGSESVEEFVESFYDDMLDWQSVLEWDRDLYEDGRIPSLSPHEIVPVVIALLKLTEGEPNRSIIEGASFGRQADTIAGLLGNIVGSLHGASAIRDDWIETCEEANEALFSDTVEGGPPFRTVSEQLVTALEEEYESVSERKKEMERILGK